MNCSYKTAIDTLHWYRQDSRRGFAHLILIRSNEREKLSGRLRVTLDNSIKGSSLSITASQAADTATYLCATDTQCSPGNCSPNANPARAASQKPQQCVDLVVMSSHKGESTNSWQQEREACQIPDVLGSMLDQGKGHEIQNGKLKYQLQLCPSWLCVLKHTIGVAAFSFLTLNKGFGLMSLKTLQALILPGHLWTMRKDLSVLEGLICYMYSPLRTQVALRCMRGFLHFSNSNSRFIRHQS